MQKILKDLEQDLISLEKHSLYKSINSLEQLRTFMDYHVYCVWDFMSLLKFLQHHFCPAEIPWTPPKSREVARFINEIVVGEESDEGLDGAPMSHFELYLQAMSEVKANADIPMAFIQRIPAIGWQKSCEQLQLPVATRLFMQSTFSFLDEQRPHLAAAAFALGREKVIPRMFQSLLDQFGIGENEAPHFHYYIKRHIEVDGDHHGPLAIKMLEILCDTEEKKAEAMQAAKRSLTARKELWNVIKESMT